MHQLIDLTVKYNTAPLTLGSVLGASNAERDGDYLQML